jgi:hypothetical protein
MSKKNTTPMSVRISLYVAKLAGETAGVAKEIKVCSTKQYKASKKASQIASNLRIKAFVPKV